METITTKEIIQLYKRCGLNPSYKYGMRVDINTGTMNNKLNSDYSFFNRAYFTIDESKYYQKR